MDYLVEIRGDHYKAMDLLARQGIQNLRSLDGSVGKVTARLSADSAEAARDRVGYALGDGFQIGSIRQES